MHEEKPFCEGHVLSNAEIHALIRKHDAEVCYGMIACSTRHMRTGKKVVLLVLEGESTKPVAYAPIACVHAVEAIVDRLRTAAREAFTGQPCIECERVE